MLSDRSAPPPEEPTELELALAEQRAQGVDIADLTEVDLRSGRDEAAVRTALCAPPGDPHVAVARSLQPSGVPIDPAHVVLAAGVDDAYARVFRLLCDPGDEILVPQPGDPRLEAIADDADVALAPYPLAFDGRWEFDPAAIWEAVGERTRAIVLPSPHVPTGCALHADALEALAAIELPLVIDETLARYPLESPLERPRSGDVPIFTIDGLRASPELHLAWIVASGPHEVVHEALHRLRRTPAPVASPMAGALARLLACEPADALASRASAALSELRVRLSKTRITIPPVGGGWYAALRLPAGEEDERVALRLVERGVLVAPGSAYDMPDDRWLVISLLAPHDALARGAAVLAELFGPESP
ncbi:MAG TPA: pyridoxal phosphate-dependent aminotransferase [Sandaracinaceae bacterium]